MGSLLRFKSAFKELVGAVPEPEQSEVWLWVDMQVSAYKLNGGVMTDCEDREIGKDMSLPRWLNRALSQKNLLQFSRSATEEADGAVTCGCKRRWEDEEEGRGCKDSSALDVSVTSDLPLSRGSPESAGHQVSPGNDMEGADIGVQSPDLANASEDKTANGGAMSPGHQAGSVTAVSSGSPVVTASPSAAAMDSLQPSTTDVSLGPKQEPLRQLPGNPVPSRDLSASAALKALSNQVVSGAVRPLRIADPPSHEVKEEGVDMADSKSLLKDSLERMRKKRKCEQPMKRPQVSPQQLSPPELNNNNKKSPLGLPFNSNMKGSLSDSVLRNLLNKQGHDKSANQQHQQAETPSEAVLNLSVSGGRGNMAATTPPSSASSSPSPSFSETLHFHTAPPRLAFGPTLGETAIASTVKNSWTGVSEKMRSSMTPGGHDWLEAMKRMTSLGLYRPILPATLDDVSKESMAAQLGLIVPDVKHAVGLHVPTTLHDHGGSCDYACSMCGKVFENEILLRNHAACHDRNSSYVCVHCGRKFNDRMHLDLHCSAEHG